jgi:hypothetical protein
MNYFSVEGIFMYKLNRGIPVSITFCPDDFEVVDDALVHMHRYDRKSKKLSKIATDNASLVLHAVTGIDDYLGSIISSYFFSSKNHSEEEYNRSLLFDELFIESSILSYNAKREIVFNIINQTKFCSGKEKTMLQADLKQLQEWRNAVAHGTFSIMNKTFEVELTYQSGGEKVVALTDEFWINIDLTLKRTEKVLSKIDTSILEERGCTYKRGDDPVLDKEMDQQMESVTKRMNEDFD